MLNEKQPIISVSNSYRWMLVLKALFIFFFFLDVCIFLFAPLYLFFIAVVVHVMIWWGSVRIRTKFFTDLLEFIF